MPILSVPAGQVELPRKLALLDTNVLVAYADPHDAHHEQAQLVLDEGEFDWTVLPPVVVEACGVLRKRPQVIAGLLGWLLTPGNVLLLPTPHSPLSVEGTLLVHSTWMQKYEVDFVDAYLMEAADVLTRACELIPPTPVATFDTGDFIKCSLGEHSFSLYDMDTMEHLVFRST